MSLYPILKDRDRGIAGRGSCGPSGPYLGRPTRAAWPEGQLAEAAAAGVWVAGVGGVARDWRCEREGKCANESDDLHEATDRHSVGPPRPHRRIYWTRSAALCD